MDATPGVTSAPPTGTPSAPNPAAPSGAQPGSAADPRGISDPSASADIAPPGDIGGQEPRIPHSRFNEVNEQKKALAAENARLMAEHRAQVSSLQKQLEAIQAQATNPDVLMRALAERLQPAPQVDPEDDPSHPFYDPTRAEVRNLKQQMEAERAERLALQKQIQARAEKEQEREYKAFYAGIHKRLASEFSGLPSQTVTDVLQNEVFQNPDPATIRERVADRLRERQAMLSDWAKTQQAAPPPPAGGYVAPNGIPTWDAPAKTLKEAFDRSRVREQYLQRAQQPPRW